MQSHLTGRSLAKDMSLSFSTLATMVIKVGCFETMRVQLARNQDEDTNMHSYKPKSGSHLPSPGAKMVMYMLFVFLGSPVVFSANIDRKRIPIVEDPEEQFYQVGSG